jgi:hypothetical protein
MQGSGASCGWRGDVKGVMGMVTQFDFGLDEEPVFEIINLESNVEYECEILEM